MQSAVKFIEVFDCLEMNADDPNIANIKPPLEEIYMLLKKVCGKLGPDFTQKFKEYEHMYLRFNLGCITTSNLKILLSL